MRYSRLICLLLAALGLTLFCTSDAIGERTWIEVRSPHFRVITDGSSKDARRVADNFEQMRYLFALRFKNLSIESGAPLTIVAARNDETYRDIDPALWKAQGNRLVGAFFRGWEKQFALIVLGDDTQYTAYHEYTHSILGANARWLPTWLDEGLPEFYASTRFDKDHIYIGAPSPRINVLRGQKWIPIGTMLDINRRSSYFQDIKEEQLFYAESWAMVHYMIFGHGMEGKLDKFLMLLQTGTDQKKAFQDVFGDPQAFDSALTQYVSQFAIPVGVLPPDHSFDPKSFSERTLTPAEIDYEIGCFHIGSHDFAEGRVLIEKSISLDPNLAAAHEELGFLDFEKGDDESATKEWKQALALNPSLHRSLFALTMTGPLSGRVETKSIEQLRAAQQTLQHVTQLAPRFAPAYAELALVEWQLDSMQQAYKDAHEAETLEPSRPGYRLLTGHILLRGNQPAVAASYARYVADHWFGPDRDEAVDLWRAIPADKRGDGAPLTMKIPDGADIARGRLLAISCSDSPGKKFTVTLLPDQPANAKPLTVVAGGGFYTDFSDIFWWGEDHYSACHHLAGNPGVVVYKPQGPQGPQLIRVDIREDLPDNSELGQP